jgi:nicotinamidase-related amidase
MQALLVIDMLNDFVAPGAPLEVPGARAMVPNVKQRIESARAGNIPVIYVNDSHEENDAEFNVWPPHAVRGTAGADVVEAITPAMGDVVIPKTSYSCFYKTSLEEQLWSMGVSRLTITGVVTNICVLYTAVDALMRGYEVDVPEDCVAALDDKDHRFALRQIKEVLKPSQSESV